jgi:AraC family transcriptional regulator of arabinose operon
VAGDFEVKFVAHARHAPGSEQRTMPEPGTWTYSYTLSGEHIWQFAGGEIRGAPGVVALHRRAAHRAVATDRQPSNWEGFYARFDPPGPGWAPPVGFRRVAPNAYRGEIISLTIRRRIEEIFVRLLSDASARLAIRAMRAVGSERVGSGPEDDAVWSELMAIQLRELLLLPEADPGAHSTLDQRVREALQIMSADLVTRHTLTSLARACQVSPSRFAHLFQEELGTSPIRALRQMRLRQAALHLRFSDDSIESIALTSGFSSLSHLSREFRREFGMSPRAYRSTHHDGRDAAV